MADVPGCPCSTHGSEKVSFFLFQKALGEEKRLRDIYSPTIGQETPSLHQKCEAPAALNSNPPFWGGAPFLHHGEGLCDVFVVSINTGAQYRSKNTLILSIGTPKKATLHPHDTPWNLSFDPLSLSLMLHCWDDIPKPEILDPNNGS